MQPPPRSAWRLSPLLFFFSSRRRHTRFSRDWSSDVCSSDLPVTAVVPAPVVPAPVVPAAAAGERNEPEQPVAEVAATGELAAVADEGRGEIGRAARRGGGLASAGAAARTATRGRAEESQEVL